MLGPGAPLYGTEAPQRTHLADFVQRNQEICHYIRSSIEVLDRSDWYA